MSIRYRNGKYSILGFLALLILPLSQASETLHSTLEQSNLKKALYCMDILENRPDLKAAYRINTLRNECFSKHYIQHAPHLEDGRDAVLNLFAQRYKDHPKTSISVKRTASEGDLVWIHLHVKPNPEDLGVAVIHIFRMEEGKFAEHWGVVQPVPEAAKNANTMF